MEDGWDLDGDKNNRETYGYENLRTMFNQRFSNETLALPGEVLNAFHEYSTQDGKQDDWRIDSTNVKYFHAIGKQDKDTTIVQVKAKLKIDCYAHQICFETKYFDTVEGEGDGTVPTVSASRMGNGLNYNHPLAKVEIFNIGELDHTSMGSSPEVQEFIMNALNGRSQTSLKQTATQNKTAITTPISLTYLSLIGRVQSAITVTDMAGNFAIITPSAPSRTGFINDGEVRILGANAQKFLLESQKNFTISFETSDNPIYIEARVGNANTTSYATKYIDLVLAPNKRAKLLVNPQDIVKLVYDVLGDGQAFTIVTPTTQLSGTVIYDFEPPQVLITRSWQNNNREALVQIGAIDNHVGVSNLLYSFDGTNYAAYTLPFTISVATPVTVYAFADDKVGNRSGLKTKMLYQPVCNDLYEPNDTITNVKIIPIGVTQTHKLCTNQDQDFVRFNAITGTQYRIETLNLLADTDTVIELIGPDRVTVLANNDNGNGGKSSVITKTLSRGTHYVRAYQADGVGDNNYSYDLVVNVSQSALPVTPVVRLKPVNGFGVLGSKNNVVSITLDNLSAINTSVGGVQFNLVYSTKVDPFVKTRKH